MNLYQYSWKWVWIIVGVFSFFHFSPAEDGVRTSWKAIGGGVTVNHLNTIAYNGEHFIAAGEVGAIVISTNGMDWQALDPFTNRSYRSSNLIGKNVLLTAYNTDPFGFLSVPNGFDIHLLTEKDSGELQLSAADIPISANEVYSLAHSGGKIIGLVNQQFGLGSQGHTISSSDGIRWNEIQQNLTAEGFRLMHGFGGAFFSVNPSNGHIQKSSDGLSWAGLGTLPAGLHKPYHFFGEAGGWMVISGSQNTLARSTNGVDWDVLTTNLTPDTYFKNIQEHDGIYISINSGGGVFRSTDLKSWIPITPAGQSDGWNSVVHGADKWVLVGKNGSLAWSSDADIWIPQTPSIIRNISAITQYDNNFIAISKDNKIYKKSGDNPEWILSPGTVPFPISCIHAENGMILIGGDQGKMAYSPDLVTWTRVSLAGAGNMTGIVSGFGRFWAISSLGRLYSSADGVNWTRGNLNATVLTDIYFDGTNLLATGILDGFPSSTIFTSKDGEVWEKATIQNYPLNIDRFTGITAGDGTISIVGLTRSISSKGHTGYPPILVSTDNGRSFQTHQIPLSNGRMQGISYFDGQFIAYGHHGNIYSSENGKIWTPLLPQLLTSQNLLESAYSGNSIYILTQDGNLIGQEIQMPEMPDPTPIAQDDSVTIDPGDFIYIDVIANDSHPDGLLDPASITILRQPDGGKLDVFPNGTVKYTHNGHLVGVDKFEYTIADTSGLVSKPAVVTVRIQSFGVRVYHHFTDGISIDGLGTDWSSVEPVGMDARDAAGADSKLDWRYVHVAHDHNFLLIAYDSYHPIQLNWAHNIFLDTDSLSETGYSYNSMGVDMLVQNGQMYQYVGDGKSWNWLYLNDVQSNSRESFSESAIPRILLRNAPRIRIAFYAANAVYGNDSTIDIFPDSGSGIDYTLDYISSTNQSEFSAGNYATLTDRSVPVVLNAKDPLGGKLTYRVFKPAHGSFSGIAPNLIYTPDAGFAGVDEFQWVVRNNNYVSEVIRSEVIVYPKAADGFYSYKVFNINVDGDMADWKGIPYLADDATEHPYPESGALDWRKVWMADSPYHLIIAAETAHPTPLNWSYNIFFDTDNNHSTGYRGAGNDWHIGAEYLLQGRFIYKFKGSHAAEWAWEFVSHSGHANIGRIHEWRLQRGALGNPHSFSVAFVADNGSLESVQNDYLPSSITSGDCQDCQLHYRFDSQPISLQLASRKSAVDIRPQAEYRLRIKEGSPIAIHSSFHQSFRESSIINMNIVSPVGGNWSIQASKDLKNWSDVGRVQLDSPDTLIFLPGNDAESDRFFRAISMDDRHPF